MSELSWSSKKQISAALGVAGASALVYATLIEPYHIETVDLEIISSRLPQQFDGYTVLQVSDLHMRGMGRREKILQKLLKTLPEHDLAVITGDLIHTPSGAAPFIELSKSIKARDGIYAVFGNSEHKNGVKSGAFARQLEAAGMHALVNRSVPLVKNGEQIFLLGVDDPVSQHDDLPAAVKGVPEDVFKLLLMHSPDPIALAVSYGIDLVLSGHTHGGQIQLPVIGPLFTNSVLGLDVDHGLYKGAALFNIIGFRAGRTQLYITRGVGVSGLALRFLCPPEITSITLRRP